MNAEFLQKDYDEELSVELEERRESIPTVKDEMNVEKIAQRVEHMAVSGGGVTARDFERILGRNDLLKINYLERGLTAARAVCRIQVADVFGSGGNWGTGFLVAPRLLLTNNHVIGTADDAMRSVAEFGYESDFMGITRQGKQFRFAPQFAFITNDKFNLDFTLVALEDVSEDGTDKLSNYGFLRLDPKTSKTGEGEFLTIIQHPEGDEKFVAARENKVIKLGDRSDADLDKFMWYVSDTAPGSSGAPAFNDNWQVVALHHRGVPRTKQENGTTLYALNSGEWVIKEVFEKTPEDKTNWIANEGVRISKIIADIVQQNTAAGNLRSQFIQDFLDDANGIRFFEGTIPRASVNGLRPIFTRIEEGSSFDSTFERRRPPRRNVRPVSYYDGRTGYESNFLGVEVPLPDHTVAVAKFGGIAEVLGANDNVLRYTHFSVVMNAVRKMAYYTAVNIDGKRWRNLTRGNDKWYYDPRIDESLQLGDELYGNEPVLGGNYFDRGHLVRRLDPVWGDLNLAVLANDDTFHWTNCSPQYKGFNQGQDLWQGLENYILYNTDEEDIKATVFNGPIFADDDDEHRGTQVPKHFWKVVVVRDGDNKLYSSAYVVSQAQYVRNIPFEERPTGNHNNFQVTLEKLQNLTGLQFSENVQNADVRRGSNVDLELRYFNDIQHPRRSKTTVSDNGRTS